MLHAHRHPVGVHNNNNINNEAFRVHGDPMETTNRILSRLIPAPPAWLIKKPSVLGHIAKERKELLLQCNMFAACAGKPLYSIGNNNSSHFSYICSRCKVLVDNGSIKECDAGTVHARSLARTYSESSSSRTVHGPFQVYKEPKLCECKLEHIPLLDYFNNKKANKDQSVIPKEFLDETVPWDYDDLRDTLKRFNFMRNRPQWITDPTFKESGRNKYYCPDCKEGCLIYRRSRSLKKAFIVPDGFHHCSPKCTKMFSPIWNGQVINVRTTVIPVVIKMLAVPIVRAEVEDAMEEAQIMDERILRARGELLDAAAVGDINMLHQSLDQNFQSATQPPEMDIEVLDEVICNAEKTPLQMLMKIRAKIRPGQTTPTTTTTRMITTTLFPMWLGMWRGMSILLPLLLRLAMKMWRIQ